MKCECQCECQCGQTVGKGKRFVRGHHFRLKEFRSQREAEVDVRRVTTPSGEGTLSWTEHGAVGVLLHSERGYGESVFLRGEVTVHR